MPEKLRILFISANPEDDSHLSISKERKKIENGLERYEGQFEFFNWDGIEAKDLIHVLQKYKPNILHFSGHAPENGGIPVFLDPNDNGELIPSQAFVKALSFYKNTIKCVFLNACYTYQLANEISEHISCIIGTVDAVVDEVAVEFSSIFYRLIFETDIQDAFHKSIVQLQLQNKSSQSFQIKFNEGYRYKKFYIINDINQGFTSNLRINSKILIENRNNVNQDKILKNGNKKTIKIDLSQTGIEAEGDVDGAKIEKIKNGNVNSSMKKIKTKGNVKGPTIGEIG